ncbi:MAG: glutamate racemase [Chitinophagales bacterium]|nr:glutamate racemase [Chitinophagales bacterium]
MNTNAQSPIGLFDSGIGGLTVANAILQQLPNESLVYFGDTAHLPYGDKSADTIRYFTKTIGSFLLSKECKIIVIACNTASSVAFEMLQQLAGDKAHVFNVIDAVVDEVINRKYKNVGVIGTLGTVNSNAYKNKINAKNPNVNVHQLATPLLAPMIESGFVDGQISHLVIEEYLNAPSLQDIDTLVLACTHYPLIKKEIEDFYAAKNKKVDVLATNEIVAVHIKKFMIENGIVNYEKKGRNTFYVSDYTESFEKTTQLFYKESIDLIQMPLFK